MNPTSSTTDDRFPSRRAVLAMAGSAAVGATVGTAAAEDHESADPDDRGIETPRLHRDGNLLRDPDGNKVVLRGVNVTDPARAEALHWRRPLPETIDHATDPDRGWYPRVIRIPVQTGDVANVDPDDGSVGDSPVDEVDPGEFSRAQLEAYIEHYLRPAVDYCDEIGVYAIVDYHRHDQEGLQYTNPDLDEEVRTFWEVVAPEFADDDHVLYEVYNEPIEPYAGQEQHEDVDVLDDEAEETWLRWRETAQPWVDTIREYADNVVIIGSPRWSQWTYWAPRHEFEGENLAYAAHVYTHENLRPLADYFGDPSEEVPVFLSEFGYQSESRSGNVPDFLYGTTSEHGAEFESFLEEYDSVHPQIWCFDPFWDPTMFFFDDETHEWTLQGGEKYQGEWWQSYLAERRTDDVPGTSGSEHDGPVVGGYEVQDTTGDGLYNDFDGDERTTHDDVAAFFETIDSDGVQNNPDAFDFDGDGSIGFGDLVQLLRNV